mmetsp:Transcript_59751/g.160095  ORF Transcript_59751/g.160095 Transcript_59751/m.160095 type:complete len:244 (+) Transcript_59751:760-1491(+)
MEDPVVAARLCRDILILRHRRVVRDCGKVKLLPSHRPFWLWLGLRMVRGRLAAPEVVGRLALLVAQDLPGLLDRAESGSVARGLVGVPDQRHAPVSPSDALRRGVHWESQGLVVVWARLHEADHVLPAENPGIVARQARVQSSCAPQLGQCFLGTAAAFEASLAQKEDGAGVGKSGEIQALLCIRQRLLGLAPLSIELRAGKERVYERLLLAGVFGCADGLAEPRQLVRRGHHRHNAGASART